MSINALHNEVLLLQQMQQGSEDAFTILYRHYSPQLYLKVFRLLKDRDMTEEIIQELFTRIWKKRQTIEPGQNFSGLLATSATNLVFDVFRKIKRDRVFREKIRALKEEHYYHIENDIDYNESKVCLNSALATLPPQQYRVYQLCKIEGCSYRQAAGLMGISPLTVKEYLVSANKTIRIYMTTHLVSAIPFVFFFLSP